MTKRICRQCGSALTKGARFCTSCGFNAGVVETAGMFAPETRPFPREQTDQTVSSKAGVTEELPSARTAARPADRSSASDYETDEVPQTRITGQAKERATAVVTDAPVTQPQTRSAMANQPSGGRKRLLLAAALGAVALAAGSFFFVNSRRSSETQAANPPADEAKHAASAQGAPQLSDAAANIQVQPQPAPQTGTSVDGSKSPAAQNADAGPKAPQTRSEEKPAPAASQEKKDADGIGAAEHNVSQGITYLSAGRYQDALREFEYVKKLDPGNKSVYYLIGQTYHKMDQLERALEAYRQCTSGVYASIAQTHVKTLEKKLGKIN